MLTPCAIPPARCQWKKYKRTSTRWVWDADKPLHERKAHTLTGEILSDTTVGTDGISTWLCAEDSFALVAKLQREKSIVSLPII